MKRWCPADAASHRTPRGLLTLVLTSLLASACVRLCAGARSEPSMAGPSSLRPSTSIIRLHRYDHRGREAMLEAEKRWQDRSGSWRPERTSSFVQLSEKQLHRLRDHHREMRKQTVSVGVDHQVLHTVRRHRHAVAPRRHSAPGATQVTALSGLESQFLGPIGVGTVSHPTGCAASSTSLSENAFGLARVEAEVSCQVTSESTLWVVFDTGSTNLWVSSVRCPNCPQNRSRYNHSKSETYVDGNGNIVTIQFGTGGVSGPLGKDTFRFGSFHVSEQSFGMIASENGDVFTNVPIEGIVGLAFPQMAASGTTPIFDNLIEQNALKGNLNQFTFYFSQSNPAANAISWGGIDSAFHEGEFEKFNVTEAWYWSLKLLKFKIGDEVLLDQSHGAPKAIVDSGTTFITAESGVYEKVVQALPEGKCDDMTATTHPDVTFTLQNEAGKEVDFVLTRDHYMAEWGSVSSSGNCLPTFMKIDLPQAHGPGVIFGEVFIRRYLAMFHRGNGHPEEARVGLALAKQGQDVEEHLHSLTEGQPIFPGLGQR